MLMLARMVCKSERVALPQKKLGKYYQQMKRKNDENYDKNVRHWTEFPNMFEFKKTMSSGTED